MLMPITPLFISLGYIKITKPRSLWILLSNSQLIAESTTQATSRVPFLTF